MPRDVPYSTWPWLAGTLLADRPRSCICIYELSHDAGRYVLKYVDSWCPWHYRMVKLR
jgi:hypothetical protein